MGLKKPLLHRAVVVAAVVGSVAVLDVDASSTAGGSSAGCADESGSDLDGELVTLGVVDAASASGVPLDAGAAGASFSFSRGGALAASASCVVAPRTEPDKVEWVKDKSAKNPKRK